MRMSVAQIQETIQSCKHCFMCRHACPTFLATKLDSHTPRGYALLLAEIEEGKAAWSESIVDRFYQCSQCGLCREDCAYHWPEDELVRAAREEIVAAGHAPARVRAVREKFVAQGCFERGEMPEGIDPGVIGKKNHRILYYSGWSARAYQPGIIAATARIMRRAGADWGMLADEIDTGMTLFELGYSAEARDQATRLRAEIERIGPREVVTGCAHAYRAFTEQWERLGVALPSGTTVLHVSQFLARLIEDGPVAPAQTLKGRTVGYHDPCHLGRNSGVYDEPRKVIARLTGKEPVELFHSREGAECCGAGSAMFLTDGGIAEQVARERLAGAREQGVEVLVTACPNCKTGFERAAKRYGIGIEILDIAELFSRGPGE